MKKVILHPSAKINGLLSAKGLWFLESWGTSIPQFSGRVSIPFRGRNTCPPLRFDGFCGKSGEDLLVRDSHGSLHAGSWETSHPKRSFVYLSKIKVLHTVDGKNLAPLIQEIPNRTFEQTPLTPKKSSQKPSKNIDFDPLFFSKKQWVKFGYGNHGGVCSKGPGEPFLELRMPPNVGIDLLGDFHHQP